MTFNGNPKTHTDYLDSQAQSRRSENLHNTVRKAVRRYLKDMGNHDPDNLYRLVMDQVEKPLIEEVLTWASGNQCRSASALGMSRGTLRKKMTIHRIMRD
ncbi:MAG: helix-turn-helix domain-containing protein [Xanthomonadales bacterium]|nr:helix-turn-helix domain-containing protein [Xanthomonadales bacterium]